MGMYYDESQLILHCKTQLEKVCEYASDYEKEAEATLENMGKCNIKNPGLTFLNAGVKHVSEIRREVKSFEDKYYKLNQLGYINKMTMREIHAYYDKKHHIVNRMLGKLEDWMDQ